MRTCNFSSSVKYLLILLQFIWIMSCTKSPPVPVLQSPSNFSWFWYTQNFQVEFEWTNNNGHDQYTLQISDTNDFETPYISIDISGTNYIWDSPLRGKFYWRVYPEGLERFCSDTFEFEIGPYVIAKLSTGGDIPYATSPYIYFGILYLLLGCESGLRILSSGSDPQLVSYISTDDAINDIDIKDQYAFVAAGTDGFKIIDISDPTDPKTLGEVSLPNYYGATSVGINPYAGNWYAYVGTDEGFYIIDCSILSQPQIISNIPVDTVGFIFDIDVYGDYVFAASNQWPIGLDNQGLYAIDISDPYHPKKIARHYSEGSGMSVHADHGKIWFASLPRNFEILNTLPLFELLGDFELDNPPVSGSISLSFPSEYVFIGTDEGLEVVDATSPANCSKISSIEFPYITTSAITSTGSDLGFVANTIEGLYIIKVLTTTY